SHVPEVARLHAESLTGLLASLGPVAVRAYYERASRAPEARAFVALAGGQTEGFVMGSARPAELRHRIASESRAALALAVLRGMARRPSLLGWLLRSRRGPDEGSYDARAPELIYLAVASGARGAGTGRALVGAFGEAMEKDGATWYELSVDETNDAAIAFYERLGFRPTGRYREFGIWHRRYRTELIGRGREGR